LPRERTTTPRKFGEKHPVTGKSLKGVGGLGGLKGKKQEIKREDHNLTETRKNAVNRNRRTNRISTVPKKKLINDGGASQKGGEPKTEMSNSRLGVPAAVVKQAR